MAEDRTVEVRRVYDPPTPHDGCRVLVDRLWPRGLARAKAALDDWCRDVAPSETLRRWYDHDPDRFHEFRDRYRSELDEPDHAEALAQLQARSGPRLVLLTATRDLTISHARVLAERLSNTSRHPQPDQGEEGSIWRSDR
jgi:uncharacterized protein YeaO (DUF488 family)